MKTIRTILATFGVTSMLYGLFALISMRLNPKRKRSLRKRKSLMMRRTRMNSTS